MEKKDIIEFFDKCAPSWDANMIRDDEIINTILDYAKVSEGKDILDVACGTGVLIPDYLNRNVKSITAIDVSPEMVKIAAEKFASNDVNIICGDVETEEFEQLFKKYYGKYFQLLTKEEVIKENIFGFGKKEGIFHS